MPAPLSPPPFASCVRLIAAVLTMAVGATLAHDPHAPGSTRFTFEQANPWSHLEFHDDPGSFQFAIVTDRTGGHRAGVFPDGLRKANLLEPEFVMSVGDLIEGYSKDADAFNAEWDELESFVDAHLDMPFFYVAGNHDIHNEVTAAVWQERFGPSYYHFVYKDVLFLCLNSEDGERANITAGQIAYADSVLSANRDVHWTLVFLHQPLWVYTDDDGSPADTGWAGIEALIRDRRHSVFAGHFHRYQKYERNDQDYFILATTGGGSSLRGPLYGEFDHVVWVTMTDDGPKVANLMLAGIWDADVRNEQTAALTTPITRGSAINIPPIFLTAANRAPRLATTLRLFNDADVPLRLSGEFARHPALSVSPDAFDIELPPNQVEILDLQVTAATGAELRAHDSVALEWEAAYRQDEVPLPEMSGTYSLEVLQLGPESTIRAGGTPVTVDGDLGEWDELPVDFEEGGRFRSGEELWTGAGDASCRFGLRYDDDFIYVAVNVIDDTRVFLEEKQYPWEQDAVEIRLDARPDPRRSLSRDGGDVERSTYITIWFAPGRTPDEAFMFTPEPLAELGVKVMGLFTDTGYTCEVAVPMAYVTERQGEDWDKVRLNVTIDDRDGEDGLCQLWWRPHWSDGDSFPGLGTFTRE